MASKSSNDLTHLPGVEGPPCGLRPPPRDPKSYDGEAPTCPGCASYLEKATQVTRGILRRQAAGDAALAAEAAASARAAAPAPKAEK